MDREKIKKRLYFWHFFLWIFLFITLYQAYMVYFVDITSTKSKWVALFAGVLALLCSSIKICENLFYNHKDLIVEKIVKYFDSGLMIFFKKNLKFLFLLSIVLCLFLNKIFGFSFVVCFVCGEVVSFLVYYVGIFISSRTSIRVIKALDNQTNVSFKLAFNSGIVISMAIVGLFLSAIAILFHIYKDYEILTGFLLGISLCAFINCSSSAIIKKSADCASGFVSGFMAEIDSYDKRSPILLLRSVSKTLFNLSSFSSDMLMTFASIVIASMVLGAFAYNLMGCFLPLIVASSGVFAAIFIILTMRINKIYNPVGILFSSALKTIILFAAITFYCIKTWIPDVMGLFYACLLGALGGFIVCFISSNYVFEKFKPVKNISNAAIAGFTSSFLQSIREGFMSVFLPVLFTLLIFVFSFLISEGIEMPLFGLYGISLSVLSMASTLGIMMCIYTFGFMLNSSNEAIRTYENAEALKLNTKHITFLGNVAFCIISLCKNYFNILSILCSVVVLIAYTLVANIQELDILNPYVLASLLLGVSFPFLYIAFMLSGISKTSKRLVVEVKHQFRNFPQILRFEMRPDYEKCVNVASKNAIIQALFYMILVSLIVYFATLFFSIEAPVSMVFGLVLSSVGLIFFSENSATVVRSAKKYLRNEYVNSNRSDEYSALVQNDEVFSSLRDLISPVLVSLTKFLAASILAFAPLFM